MLPQVRSSATRTWATEAAVQRTVFRNAILLILGTGGRLLEAIHVHVDMYYIPHKYMYIYIYTL